MSGTKNLEHAIDWMLTTLKSAGLDNVHTENASVPHWERGYESAMLLTPRKQKLIITGLGMSIGTQPGGIIAGVIAVDSFDEFERIPAEKVRGNIVVFAPKYESYDKTVKYRTTAAVVASKKGAVAALVRSVTPFSIGSPHTGIQFYEDGVRKIPVAALTVEDAEFLLRLYRSGAAITIRLELQDRNLGMFVSRNTIAELSGERQQPVVVVSGHLDSWDIGVGAMDDGGGAFISWKALQLIKHLNLKRPKRTIRAILWTGEEQGIYGAQAYAEQHKSTELDEFSFFIESDTGTFEPLGFDFSGTPEAACIVQEIVRLFGPMNATQFRTPMDGGPDIDKWVNRGFPGASLMNRNERYNWFHHTAGDSMLVLNSDDLDRNTALFAALSYVIADLSIDIPRNVASN